MNGQSSNSLIRAEVLERLRPLTAAWSVDGREVQFVAQFDESLRPGGFVTVTTTDGARYLVQVHGVRAEDKSGITIDVDTSELQVADVVTSASVTLVNRVVAGSGFVLDRLDDGPVQGFVDASIEPADDEMVAAYFERELGSSAGLHVGRIRDTGVDARLRAAGFARHTFMCGQSGSGKTFTLGIILERLLFETDLPVVVIDPNSDYVNLGTMASRTAVNRFRSTPLSQAEYDELAERYAERAGVVVASARSGDLPLRIHFSDLPVDYQALAMQLDPIADALEYGALVDAVKHLRAPYHVDDVQAVLRDRFDDASRLLAQRMINLGISGWSVWATSDESSLAGRGAGNRALILDSGSLADARERSIVALGVLGRLRQRPQRSPILLVIDEAHNVCPPDARTPIEQAVTDLMLWIAGEGRKYGTYLLLSTQRPQKIHRNVLSQCDNLLLMRINSTTDLAQLTEVFSHVPSPLIDQAHAHRMGELLAAGPIARTPLRLQADVRWTKEGGADLPTRWAKRAD